jgi:hypothetical protein
LITTVLKSLLGGGLLGVGSLGSGLLLLGVLGEELLVSFGGLLGGGPASLGLGLDGGLAAETGLGDHALNAGRLVEGLVTALDLTLDDVVADIVLLLVESEGLDDVSATLAAEAVGAGDVGDTVDLLLALLDDAEEDGGEVGAGDAAADGLALTLTLAALDVAGAT